MKKLEFKIDIAAGKQKVWDVMLGHDTYKEWVGAAWPGSDYHGEWKQGANLRFVGDGQGGTLANLVECKPYDYILAKHIAVLTKDGEDRTSEIAQNWIGSTESYTFTETNGKTELKVEMNIFPQWESMFAKDWPKALKALKELIESKN